MSFHFRAFAAIRADERQRERRKTRALRMKAQTAAQPAMNRKTVREKRPKTVPKGQSLGTIKMAPGNLAP
jgi:hypothetical protein